MPAQGHHRRRLPLRGSRLQRGLCSTLPSLQCTAALAGRASRGGGDRVCVYSKTRASLAGRETVGRLCVPPPSMARPQPRRTGCGLGFCVGPDGASIPWGTARPTNAPGLPWPRARVRWGVGVSPRHRRPSHPRTRRAYARPRLACTCACGSLNAESADSNFLVLLLDFGFCASPPALRGSSSDLAATPQQAAWCML